MFIKDKLVIDLFPNQATSYTKYFFYSLIIRGHSTPKYLHMNDWVCFITIT